jgi:hypothetical protein
MTKKQNESYLSGVARLLEIARRKIKDGVELLGEGGNLAAVQQQFDEAAEALGNVERLIDEESARIVSLPITEAVRAQRVVELHSVELMLRKEQLEHLQSGIARLSLKEPGAHSNAPAE